MLDVLNMDLIFQFHAHAILYRKQAQRNIFHGGGVGGGGGGGFAWLTWQIKYNQSTY